MSMAFRMEDVLKQVEEEAIRQGVDPRLAKAIIIAENTANGDYNPNQLLSLSTKSPMGAVGFGQVMPETLEGLIRLKYLPADIDYNTPEGQIKASVAAIREKQDLYKSTNPDRLAIAYNASYRANREYERSGALPSETAQYRQKVAKAMNFFEANNAPDPQGIVQPQVPGMANTSSRTTKSTSRKLLPEDIHVMLMEALGEFRDGQTSASGVSAQISAALAANEQVVNEALDKVSGALATKTDATKNVARAENAQRRNNLRFFGIDTEDPSQQIIQDRAAEMQADAVLRQLQPELAAIDAANPLTDPVGWFMGQIKKTQLAGQWNAAARQKDIAVANQKSAQARAAAQAALVPQVAEQERNRILDSELTAAAAQITLEMAKHKDKTLSSQIALMSNEMQYRGERFRQVLSVANLLSEREARGQVDGVSFKPGEEAEFNLINAGRIAMGMRPIESIAEFRKANPKESAVYMQIGSRVKDASQLANTPADALFAVDFLGTLPSMKKNNPVMGEFVERYMGYVAEEFAKDKKLTNPRVAALKDEERFKHEATEIAREWTKELKEVPRDKMTETSPHRMKPSTFASAPELVNNAIAKEITKKLAEENHEMSDKEVIDFAKALIISKTMPAEQVAQQLQEFYERGLHNHNGLMGLSVLGIPIHDPAAKKAGTITYRLSREAFYQPDKSVTSVFGRYMDQKNNPLDEEVDVLNIAALTRALVIGTARQQVEQQRKQQFDMQEQLRMQNLRDRFSGNQQQVPRSN